MATTSIWRVNGWLGKVLIYIENPDKTENPAAYEKQGMDGKEAQGLSDVIEYAVQQKKTGKIAVDDEDVPVMQRFVSGVNCSPTTARDEMIAVKKRFGKEEGTVAYHGYQSFAPGEATPEMAHEIGLKLAKALWGEKYQVLVATHLDKAHHLHNHFVVNTVSFLDGIKYHRTEKDYFDMQRESDRLRDCGGLLERQGYEIKVVDLLNMNKSHCYNPFAYLKNDNDVQKMVTNLFKATTPKGSQSNDPFWDTAASMLLMALVFYLHYEAPEDEKNFPMVMEMLRAGEVREDDDSYQSPLDELFERLEMRSPDHIAVKYYKDYRSGSAKTLKSIQITLASRLEKFNLSSVAALTATDELELASLGEKKVALFALIPDNDASFNFLVSLLYASTFQELFYSADRVHGGSLPVPVHFLMDEFANVSLPDDFDKLLATMRSRNISVSIIIQNIAQLKALYEKQWESIMGNCDEFLYLGGNESSTHKLISESYLGKSTLWLDTYGKSTGHSGSYSTNNQITGRELMTPDEVRMLDNRLALLFIRGEPPLMDEKYELLKHPNVKYTTDGGAPAYAHGGTENAVAGLTISRLTPGDLANLKEPDVTCELLSDEDMEKIFQFKEEKQNETV